MIIHHAAAAISFAAILTVMERCDDGPGGDGGGMHLCRLYGDFDALHAINGTEYHHNEPRQCPVSIEDLGTPVFHAGVYVDADAGEHGDYIRLTVRRPSGFWTIEPPGFEYHFDWNGYEWAAEVLTAYDAIMTGDPGCYDTVEHSYLAAQNFYYYDNYIDVTASTVAEGPCHSE
jgi:hypothetical protein